MAYTYRASTSQGNASGSALTVTKPTGTVDGDLIVVVAYLESDTNTWASVGSGFNTSGPLTIDNTGAFQLQVWWKWASSEPASWTWTPTTGGNWRTVVVASYSGGSGSGTALDVSGSAQGDSVLETSQTAPSVTTTVNDDLLTWGYGNFSGTNVITMLGAASNMRVSFGGATIADANRPTLGATGTSAPNSGPGTDDYAALHAAFFLSPGGATKAPPPRRRPYHFFKRRG